jgi:ABC-2 type transport system permease protein
VAEIEQRSTPFRSLREWWEQESRRPTGGSPAARIAQLSRRRGVLRMLVVRDLKKRYENSYLGYAWTLVEPALLITIYWLVFGNIGKLHIHHYILFIATAMMPWVWFRNTCQGACDVISGNSKLVSSINLPREIYPLALCLTEGIEFLATLPLVWLLAAIYGVRPTHYLFILPAVIVLEMILVTGAALLLAALTTLFQDIERVMGSFLRVLFYLTPVIYPSGRIHGSLHKVYSFDPLVGIFELNRAVFFHPKITSTMLTVSIVGSLVLFVAGWAIFIRLEHSMLKEL